MPDPKGPRARAAATTKKGARKAGAGGRRALTLTAAGDVHARVSSAAVRSRTRRTWPQWFRILDSAGAREQRHPEIVLYLTRNYGRLSPWWCQMIAGAYEQARGLRAQHEMPDGFQVTGSKTVGVSVSRLYRAFKDGAARKQWLPGHAIQITKATPRKSLRFVWTDGTSRVSANFNPRGPTKAQVAVVHRKVQNAREAARMNAFWKERLARLKDALEGEDA